MTDRDPRSNKVKGELQPHQENNPLQSTTMTSQREDLFSMARTCAIKLAELVKETQATNITEQNISSQVQLVENSVSIVNSFIKLLSECNNLAGLQSEQSTEVAVKLFPIAYSQIASLAKEEKIDKENGGSKKFLTDNQRIFATVLQKNSINCGLASASALPSWFTPIFALAQVTSLPTEWPEPITYFKYAKTEKDFHDLNGRLQAAKLHQKKVNQAVNSTGAANGLQEAERTLEKIKEEIVNTLVTRTDIQLKKMDELTSAFSLNLSPNAIFLKTINKFTDSFGKLIQTLSNVDTANQEPLQIELTYPSFSLSAKGIVQIETKTLTLTGTNLEFLEQLPKLLNSYSMLRSSLINSLVSVSVDSDLSGDLRGQVRELKYSLSNVFPKSIADSVNVISKLAASEVPAVAEIGSSFLLSQVTSKSEGAIASETSYLLAQTDALILVDTFTRNFINGSLTINRQQQHELSNSNLAPLVAQLATVKGLLESAKISDLARFIDDKLLAQCDKSVTANRYDQSSSNLEAYGLMTILTTVSQNQKIARGLKAGLQRLDLVAPFCELIIDKFKGSIINIEKNVENSRKLILKGLSNVLADYRGQSVLKKDFIDTFDKNIRRLKEPSGWTYISSKLVITNGFLLHGEPGTGKTFFIECLANQYGLPLISISREDIAEYRSTHANKNGKSEATEQIGSYLKEKVEEAQKQMKKSGAIAAIVVMDEIEAEFRKRDPLLSSRSDLDETNRMLRVFEKVMMQHPNIFFMATTNHIDLVDEAALRIGRYGYKFKLNPPNEDDATDLIKGTLEMLDIEETKIIEHQEFNKLITKAVGLTPQALQTALITSYLDLKENLIDGFEPLFESFVTSLDRMHRMTANEPKSQLT
jgi:AAA+ superfamily predicted ATPase